MSCALLRWSLTLCAVTSGLSGCDSAIDAEHVQQQRPSAIRKLSGDEQTATTATPVPNSPTVEVVDSAGRPVPGVQVTFDVVDGNGWVASNESTTDGAGRASAIWYLGPLSADSQQLEARIGTLATRFNAMSVRATAGTAIVGKDSYIEWIPGDLPIVLTAPHGGTLVPTEIPDRTTGTTTRDLNTDDLARDIAVAFEAKFGKRPHLVICRLSRRKLDANREIVEAAAGNAAAERAWREYHGFIDASTADIRRRPGIGFYVDLHGHGHAIQRLELGYLLGAGTLALTDGQLSTDLTTHSSSLWSIAAATGTSIADLIRGSTSLGALLESAGYPSVPSPATPSPGADPYFDGGYSTVRHAAPPDHRFAGVQIEAHLTGVRDTPGNRAAFASALVNALDEFLRVHRFTGLVRPAIPRPAQPSPDTARVNPRRYARRVA